MKRLALVVFALGLVLSVGLAAQNGSPPKPSANPSGRPLGADWAVVGGDRGSSKFSPLAEITAANVSRLAKAWTYDLGAPGEYTPTPIVVGNVMFVPHGTRAIALAADTGTELWKTDLKANPALGSNPSTGGRGVSYWPGTPETGPRIVIATANGFIVQLDAKTGQQIAGPAGVMNMAVGVTDKFAAPGQPPAYGLQMPPAIYRNLAIVAGRMGVTGRYGVPGDPRAFDLLTGKEVWRFHVVPQPGEDNFGTWGLNGWQDRSGPGVWVPMTVDSENDLLFVPVANAKDQNFAANRPGENLYAASLLVLRASTGKRVWHFQATHHDVYDADVNSPPSLFETTIDGQRVLGVAQLTKMAYLFLFNRLTGEPLFGVEERPVPWFDAPGDEAWPTQPFPVKPAGLARNSMTRAEVSKISPEAEKYCTEVFDKTVNMGPYTPYGMVPNLVFPGSEGGGGWSGVATNSPMDLVFLNTRNLGVTAQLQPIMTSGVLPSFHKTKVPTTFYTDPRGYPCSVPPWSELIAVSASTGDIVWRVPLGEYPELAAKGLKGYGTALNDGGPITTASGLVFIGATGDFGFRAFDGKTGRELWKATLDNDVLMTPLTYLGGNGKQYVVGVAGTGDSALHIPARVGRAANTTVYAFALP